MNKLRILTNSDHYTYNVYSGNDRVLDNSESPYDMDYFRACQLVMSKLDTGDTVTIDNKDAVSAVRFSIHFTSLLAYQTETIEVLQKTLNRVLE